MAFHCKDVERAYTFLLKKLLLLSYVSNPFYQFCENSANALCHCQFLIRSSRSVSWNADEVTAVVDKVEAKDSVFSLILPWYRYTAQYYSVVMTSWNL